MLYSFELVMLGVIVLGAMAACGCAILWRRRRERAGAPASPAGDGPPKP